MKNILTLKNLGWLLIAIVSFMTLKSGISKLIQTEDMVAGFEYMKLSPYLTLIGLLEVIGVAGLLYPKTSSYGALLLTTVFSGAAAIHLSMLGGQGVIFPILMGLLTWSGHCLRKY